MSKSRGVSNHTIAFRNDLRETVEVFRCISDLQFDFNEHNGNPTQCIKLVFNTTLRCEPTLQDCFWGIEQVASK